MILPGNQMKEERALKQKKGNYWMAVLICITIVALGVAAWALRTRKSEQVLAPDYAPETEANAETMEAEEKMPQPEGGGAVSLMYSTDVSISLENRTAALLFANPSRSNQAMVVQIVIQDVVIAQSGLLEPGNQVTSLEIPDTSMLQPGTYDGTFLVSYYQPESGERAMINTEVPIQVQVGQ